MEEDEEKPPMSSLLIELAFLYFVRGLALLPGAIAGTLIMLVLTGRPTMFNAIGFVLGAYAMHEFYEHR